MFPAFPIGSIFGVKIRVHLLFLVLIAFLIFSNWPSFEVHKFERFIFIAILWGSVLFHELGHSLVARRYKVKVLDITFWPLGGMARFADFPTDPRIELPIAIAGPAVNFLIAAALLPWVDFGNNASLQDFLFPWLGNEGSWVKTAWGLNLSLAVFNLIPAFPTDGGRVFRALLAFRWDYLRATEISVKTGRLLALALLIAAFIRTDMMLILILLSVFIWFSGTQELWSVRLRHATKTGNPFIFWKSFHFGAEPQRKTSSEPEIAIPKNSREESEKTQKELESFKGSLEEYFKKKNDPDGS